MPYRIWIYMINNENKKVIDQESDQNYTLREVLILIL